MQEIHAWLVGFGVGQFEKWRNPKASCISCITPLRSHTQGQINTCTQTYQTIKTTKQVHWESDVPGHIPNPPQLLVHYAQIKGWIVLCWSEEKKANKIAKKHDSQHSYSSLLWAPNGGWSVIQDSSAALQGSMAEIQYRDSKLTYNLYQCNISRHRDFEVRRKICL